APIAVHIDSNITAIQPWLAERAQKSVGGLLALQGAVVARTVAGLVNLVEIRGAQQHVVIGENPFVMAKTSIGGVEILVVRTARISSDGVVDDAIAGDK